MNYVSTIIVQFPYWISSSINPESFLDCYIRLDAVINIPPAYCQLIGEGRVRVGFNNKVTGATKFFLDIMGNYIFKYI